MLVWPSQPFPPGWHDRSRHRRDLPRLRPRRVSLPMRRRRSSPHSGEHVMQDRCRLAEASRDGVGRSRDIRCWPPAAGWCIAGSRVLGCQRRSGRRCTRRPRSPWPSGIEGPAARMLARRRRTRSGIRRLRMGSHRCACLPSVRYRISCSMNSSCESPRDSANMRRKPNVVVCLVNAAKSNQAEPERKM